MQSFFWVYGGSYYPHEIIKGGVFLLLNFSKISSQDICQRVCEGRENPFAYFRCAWNFGKYQRDNSTLEQQMSKCENSLGVRLTLFDRSDVFTNVEFLHHSFIISSIAINHSTLPLQSTPSYKVNRKNEFCNEINSNQILFLIYSMFTFKTPFKFRHKMQHN